MQALEAVSHPNGLETAETANVLVCLFCAQTGDGDARELQTVFFQRFCQTTCFWDICHALPQSVAAAQLSVGPVSWCV